MPPARRTGTCPICEGTMRETRREPGTFLCDKCARYLPESEVENVRDPLLAGTLEDDL